MPSALILTPSKKGSMGVFVSNHPLIKHKLALLRDANTQPILFRALIKEISTFLFYEATYDLPLFTVQINTPLGVCDSQKYRERLGIIPILRAGLGMAEAMLELMPQATVWHLGLYRDHATHQPITYYNKLPLVPNINVGLIVDPMLATGGSASAAVAILEKWGLETIKFVAIIAAPEGIESMRVNHPDVPIHVAAIDTCLNVNKYIFPGLGDAGDRQFATI